MPGMEYSEDNFVKFIECGDDTNPKTENIINMIIHKIWDGNGNVFTQTLLGLILIRNI